MAGRKKYNAGAGEPLRWRITEWDGRLRLVLLDMAPPCVAGESIVWEGAAKHIAEAYRVARDSGLPIYLDEEGFKMRRRRFVGQQIPEGTSA